MRKLTLAAIPTLGLVGVLAACGWMEDPRAEAERRSQELAADRQALDATVWAEERLAQQYEATFVSLWDDLRQSEDPFGTLAAFELGEIEIGEPSEPRELLDGIFRADLDQSPRTLTRDQWIGFLNQLKTRGFTLVQSEWHYASFNQAGTGHRVSIFNVVLHATNADDTARYEITGPIRVSWSDQPDSAGRFVPSSIDAIGLSVAWRRGAPIFEEFELANFVLAGRDIVGVSAYDLNGDHLADLVYTAQNAVLWNRGHGRFEQAELLDHPLPELYRGVFADFTGDGSADYLVAAALAGPPPRQWGLFLYEPDASGRFSTPSRSVADPEAVTLFAPSSYAIGDVDRDGDLDLYVGQYKDPYRNGQFPDPYYDANDGHPAYLLLNEGDGRLVDGTERPV